ncbi:MAG: hypothetical protein ACXV74_04350 [Methylobacter sp.]
MSPISEKLIPCQFASALPRNESFYLFNRHHAIIYTFVADKSFEPLSAFPVGSSGFKLRRQGIRKRQLIYNYMITIKIKSFKCR